MAAAPTIDINTILNFVFILIIMSVMLQMVGRFVPKT